MQRNFSEDYVCIHVLKIRLAVIFFPIFFGGCNSLLPRSENATEGPWKNYQEAQQIFDQIIPYQTSFEDLKRLKLNPESNPNIAILTYSDVIRRFIPSSGINADQLAPGIQECILATESCKGYEIVQRTINRKRNGNFWLDFTNFKRTIDVTGWSFNGVILVKDNLVIYKLAVARRLFMRSKPTRILSDRCRARAKGRCAAVCPCNRFFLVPKRPLTSPSA